MKITGVIFFRVLILYQNTFHSNPSFYIVTINVCLN